MHKVQIHAETTDTILCQITLRAESRARHVESKNATSSLALVVFAIVVMVVDVI